jgi:hypothetical protein
MCLLQGQRKKLRNNSDLQNTRVIMDGFFGTSDGVTGIKTSLDLCKNELFGFQYTVSPTRIDNYCKLIRSGAEFPRVCVTTADNQSYHIAFLTDPKNGKPDGGHHRAYAYFLEKRPLPVKIIPLCYQNRRSRIPIQDMTFTEETLVLNYPVQTYPI